ncbi:MAG: hypothetical protein K2X08_01865 [Chlamydiales bacterium]|nr:hypothetical protein [Chlamydiales bacterium]
MKTQSIEMECPTLFSILGSNVYEYVQKDSSENTIAQIACDIILSTAIFISSALMSFPFIPTRFVLLLWNGTFYVVSVFVISRLINRILDFGNHWMEWISSTILALGLFNIQSFIHECGHAIAGIILLQQPNITIKIIPFFGGSTKFIPMTASFIAQFFKAQQVFLVIAASGPLLSLSLSCCLLRWGIKKLELYPRIGRLAVCAATIDVLFHLHSAISALQLSPIALQYDFVTLWTLGGIHPIVCASFIIGLPVFCIYTTQKEACLTLS